MSRGLEQAAARLRGAVEAGDFGAALAALPAFRRELDAALVMMPPGAPDSVTIAAEASDLLEWARRVTLCARAHVAAQLDALACTDAYAGARPARRRWEMDG